MNKILEREPRWHIWFRRLDFRGQTWAGGVSAQSYSRKDNAIRAARKQWGDIPCADAVPGVRYGMTERGPVEWQVSQTNPWCKNIQYERNKVLAYLLSSIGASTEPN